MKEIKIIEDSIKINSGEIIRLREKTNNLDFENREILLRHNYNREKFKSFLNLNKGQLYEINKESLINFVLNISMVE